MQGFLLYSLHVWFGEGFLSVGFLKCNSVAYTDL